eukprot:g52845.t1
MKHNQAEDNFCEEEDSFCHFLHQLAVSVPLSSSWPSRSKKKFFANREGLGCVVVRSVVVDNQQHTSEDVDDSSGTAGACFLILLTAWYTRISRFDDDNCLFWTETTDLIADALSMYGLCHSQGIDDPDEDIPDDYVGFDEWKHNCISRESKTWGKGVCWAYMERGECDEFKHYGAHPTVTLSGGTEQVPLLTAKVTQSRFVPAWDSTYENWGSVTTGLLMSTRIWTLRTGRKCCWPSIDFKPCHLRQAPGEPANQVFQAASGKWR